MPSPFFILFNHRDQTGSGCHQLDGNTTQFPPQTKIKSRGTLEFAANFNVAYFQQFSVFELCVRIEYLKKRLYGDKYIYDEIDETLSRKVCKKW